MSEFKVVQMEPTPEMVEAAEDAYMPFGDMDLAIRMAILTAPVVQGEQDQELVPAGKPDRITEQDVRDIATSYCHWKSVGFYNTWFSEKGRELLNKLNADREQVPTVAALVSALESAKNLIANHSGEVLPDKYAGDQIEQIDAALAAYRKGGEV